MPSQSSGSKRPLLDNFLHPGEWRNKRSRSGSRSGSPSASGAMTPGDGFSHYSAQSNPGSRSPSPVRHPGPSAPGHGSLAATAPTPAPPPNAAHEASVTTSTRNSTGTAWTGLEQALQALRVSPKICPPLSSAVGDLASCLSIFEAAARNRTDYDELATGLKSMVDLLIRHLSDAPSEEILDALTGIAETIRKEIESINMYKSRSLPHRMFGPSNTDDDLIRRYRRIEQLFRQLQGEASLGTWSAVNELLVDKRLENLRPTNLARFNSELSTEVSRRGCTKDTRTKILDDSIAWSENPNLAKIYWMNGMAGTGKTTIAYSFCERLEAGKQLAASFFCTRASPECRDAKRIIPTIAYQLARRLTPFRYSLCQQLKKDPDISTSQLSYQFDSLLKKPLVAAKDKLSNNLVIVVDALDECSEPHIVELFLDLLFRSVMELPIKFFVTSRPEPAIRNRMMPESERSRSILYLHEIELSLVQADIELYLRDELTSIAPADEDIVELAEHAGNLFIYAATAVRYIRPVGKVVNSKARLKAILAISAESTKKLSAIDALYTAILTAAIEDQELEVEEQDQVRLVLWTAICACEPILIHTLSILSGLDNKEATIVALESLRSVLHVSEHSELVTTLHASFPDYMLTRERSGTFYCDKAAHSQLLAEQCFAVMKSQLRFNICCIRSSFLPNDQIPGLGEQISTKISKELFYACRFWMDHLFETNTRDTVLPLAREFLSKELLFWMEVMSLKNSTALGATSITKLSMWLTQAVDTNTELSALASDARRFVTRYASSPIASYTPHIYLSALPLSSPSSSSIRTWYLPRFKGLIKVFDETLDKLENAALGVWVSTSPIRSATFSPGGDYIILGDEKGRISVQNAYDGKHIVQPFKAHKKVVTSLGVSSDGMQMVSGSHDMTLSVWNMHDGSLINGPFKGHTNRITSVAFSPDNAHMISGSDDCVVGIWDPQNPNIIMRSLTGHTKEVKSVAFSPDGSRVISGSADCTVRLWNLSSGATIFVLNDHTQSVSSVQFSPNGAYIVSGSYDSTVRIWNTCDGSLSGRPLRGHSKRITSIAISPSGNRIVSGSLDRTVRVWDESRGELITGPFEGHTDSVRSVGFSGDGMRIMSASDDKTIRIWNAEGRSTRASVKDYKYWTYDLFTHSPNQMYVAFTRHRDDTTFLVCDLQDMLVVSVSAGEVVRCLQFSHDGTRIHSTHNDGTLRTWNTQTGGLLDGPHRCTSLEYFTTSRCSADGVRVVTSGMNKAELWHVQGSRATVFHKTSSSTGLSVTFSQTGNKFITYDREPASVKVWDGDTGRCIVPSFLAITNRVDDFSHDGTYICYHTTCGHTQNGLQVMNVNNGETVTLPESQDFHYGALFTPDGLNVIGINDANTCRIWNIRDQTFISIPTRVEGCKIKITQPIGCSPDGWVLLASHTSAGLNGPHRFHVQRFHIDNPSFASNSDGWVLDSRRQPLIWVPTEIREDFPMCNEIVLSGNQLLQCVNYDDMLVGDEWSKCYVDDTWFCPM